MFCYDSVMGRKHHYILTDYPDGWALGRCKWCGRVEPFRQYPLHNSYNQVIEATLAEKRKFLSSIGITIHSSRWHDSEKLELINSVKRIGINQTAKKFGLGRQILEGFLEERSGVVPNTKWKKKFIGKNWYLGETLHSGIGQGYYQTTPMQLCLMMAQIANGGYEIKPRIIRNEKMYLAI